MLAPSHLTAFPDLHLQPGYTWPIKECAHTHTSTHTCIHSAFLSASQVNTVDRVCVLCSVLTHYIQGVRVVDGSKLILHQASVVALVRRHHTLHDQGPMLVTDLCLKKKKAQFLFGELKKYTAMHTQEERKAD